MKKATSLEEAYILLKSGHNFQFVTEKQGNSETPTTARMCRLIADAVRANYQMTTESSGNHNILSFTKGAAKSWWKFWASN